GVADPEGEAGRAAEDLAERLLERPADLAFEPVAVEGVRDRDLERVLGDLLDREVAAPRLENGRGHRLLEAREDRLPGFGGEGGHFGIVRSKAQRKASREIHAPPAKMASRTIQKKKLRAAPGPWMMMLGRSRAGPRPGPDGA